MEFGCVEIKWSQSLINCESTKCKLIRLLNLLGVTSKTYTTHICDLRAIVKVVFK